MNGRRRLGLIAAAATLLSAAPLSAIFESWSWLMQSLVAVGLICGAAALARTLRFPAWVQAAGMLLALLFALTWMFPGDHGFLIPGPGTFRHFGDLLSQAGEDTRSYAVPVPDRDALQFVAVLGIGAVAVAVDLLTVVARRPALAGLPMLAIYSVPVAVYIDSVPVLPFIIGSFGYLWLLVSDNVDRVRRFGRRFTGDGRDVDVWEPSPLAAAARRLGFIGIAAAVLLPVAIPQFTGGLLSSLTQNGAGVGIGGGKGNAKINLFSGLKGQLNDSATQTLLKVYTNETEPYYLRFAVADQLSADGAASQDPKGQDLGKGMPDTRTGIPAGTDARQFHAEVEVSALQQPQAPVYGGTYAISGLGGGWSYDQTQQVVFSGRNTTKGKKYSFDYVRTQPTPQQLRDSQLAKNDPYRTAYTSTPKDDLVTSTVKGLTGAKTNQYDTVLALYDFFSRKNNFSYSLTTGDSNGLTDIDAFLRNRTGYCQQYATALTWMVRAAGYPARVAFGFTRGQLVNGQYVITNHNAHAWTEVYFAGYGWVPFDATPSAGITGSAHSLYAPDVNETTAPATSAAPGASLPGNSISAGPDSQHGADHNLNDPAASGLGTTTSAPVSGDTLWIAIGVALLLALLMVPALVRTLQRRRRNAATAPVATIVTGGGPPAPAGGDLDIVITTDTVQARADAHAAWDELLDTMADYRVPIDLSETPRVTARRLIREAELTGGSATAATLLGTAEEKARYARSPLRGAELTKALQDVRKGISQNVSRRTRVIAVLFPPSTLLRWRLSIADASTRVFTFAGRIRDFLVRFSPRRLLPRSSSSR